MEFLCGDDNSDCPYLIECPHCGEYVSPTLSGDLPNEHSTAFCVKETRDGTTGVR